MDSNLFARLYLDEDVSVLVADLVGARGFDVTTTRDENQLGNSDEAQLVFARERQRALVTHNRSDFERLNQVFFEAEKTHWGIIISRRRPPSAIAKRLTALLNKHTARELRNQVVYI
jgi:predicted nuclease of predicted toxin-antitoxin system